MSNNLSQFTNFHFTSPANPFGEVNLGIYAATPFILNDLQKGQIQNMIAELATAMVTDMYDSVEFDYRHGLHITSIKGQITALQDLLTASVMAEEELAAKNQSQDNTSITQQDYPDEFGSEFYTNT